MVGHLPEKPVFQHNIHIKSIKVPYQVPQKSLEFPAFLTRCEPHDLTSEPSRSPMVSEASMLCAGQAHKPTAVTFADNSRAPGGYNGGYNDDSCNGIFSG